MGNVMIIAIIAAPNGMGRDARAMKPATNLLGLLTFFMVPLKRFAFYLRHSHRKSRSTEGRGRELR